MKNYTTWQKKEPRERQLTWLTAQRQRTKEAGKERRTLELKFKNWSQLERAAALAELAHMQEVDSSAHIVGSTNNKRLAQKYSKAAGQMTGRSVEVQIRRPSSKESAGQFTRTEDRGYIQLDPGLDARSTINTFLHETSHCMLHWNDVATSKLHLKSPRSINSPVKPSKNQAKYDLQEKEANELANKLITCVEFDINPTQPNYENRALDYLILHS